MSRIGIIVGMLAGLAGAIPAAAGEKKEPPKIEPVTEAEKQKLLAAENAQQKRLRAELAMLAKQGHRIYFNANIHGNDDIFSIAPDGTDLQRLTDSPAEETYPHVSPDGERILFHYADPAWAKKGIPKDKLTELMAEVPCDPKYPANDWRKRTYPKGLTMLAGLDCKDPKPVGFGGLPHWHPNGNVICMNAGIAAGGRDRSPVLVDLKAKTEKVIRPVKPADFGCFSPDGKYLYTSNGDIKAVALNAEGNDMAEGGKPMRAGSSHVCNTEVNADGKHMTYVIDTFRDMGSWLCYSPLENGKCGKRIKMNLGWPDKSVNYYQDVSPDCRYMVYSHGEMQEGVKSYHFRAKLELYVTRFPPDGVNARITWNGAANYHPHWPPPAKKKAPTAAAPPPKKEPEKETKPPAASAAPPAAAPATPSSAEVCRGWLSLAMSYKRAGRRDKAREYLQKIVKEHPDSEYAAKARRELAKL